MYYINIKETATGYDHAVETIDEFESIVQAGRACKEYRMSFPSTKKVWVSSRSTMDWRNKAKAKRAEPIWKSIAKELPKDDGRQVLVETNNTCHYLGHWEVDPNKNDSGKFKGEYNVPREHIKRWCYLRELIERADSCR